MPEGMLRVRLHHPLGSRALELELPRSMTFGELLKRLYRDGFIEPKPADYGFIVDQRICALNKSLASYIPPETKDVVDIDINGLLTIMS